MAMLLALLVMRMFCDDPMDDSSESIEYEMIFSTKISISLAY